MNQSYLMNVVTFGWHHCKGITTLYSRNSRPKVHRALRVTHGQGGKIAANLVMGDELTSPQEPHTIGIGTTF